MDATDQETRAAGDAEESGEEGGADRSRRERLTDAIHAFREAIEQSVAEARDRGDAAEARARELLRVASERAKSATAEARERFDFVTHDRFEELEARVARLEAKLADRLGDESSGEEEAPPPE